MLHLTLLKEGYQASVQGTNRKVHPQAPACTGDGKGAGDVAAKKCLGEAEEQQVIQRFPDAIVTSVLLTSMFTHTGGRSR